MRRTYLYSLLSLVAVTVCLGSPIQAQAAQPKDWTFLIFLNGNNSLDSFGTTNLLQMEKVGSNDKLNIVVQWASMSTGKTERLLVQKSSDNTTVTSPVVQNVDGTDMGDWNSVVDFVKWGAEHYPAKHYFLDIWDHGSGWHGKKGQFGPKDISLDENTGHMITTQQLGQALSASAKIIGHKIDIYASDACLMAMAEIADEMADSVSIYAGSEETEPGAGWPYDTFLTRWTAKPDATAAEVGKMLSEEYAKSYEGGSENVTFSAFDLSKLQAFKDTLTTFTASMKKMTASTAKKVLAAAKKSQSFTVSDYVDLLDFVKNTSAATGIATTDQSLIKQVGSATKDLIITSNNVGFPNATGLAIWLPVDESTLSQYADAYGQLKFESETHWTDFLKALLK